MALPSAEKKTAAEVVAALDPHGGFYLETFRDPSVALPKSALPPRCKLASDRSLDLVLSSIRPL